MSQSPQTRESKAESTSRNPPKMKIEPQTTATPTPTRNQFASNRTRVRIPPSPPNLCRTCLNCQVQFRHFLLLFSSFEPTDKALATFLAISPFSSGEIIGENWYLFCLYDAKTGEHCIRRVQFGTIVQMRVNICRSGKITVTKPLLNLLHGNTICKH